ncbi:hypothetical protein EOM33_05915 [Candidatus Saccharibacteria bacterium]|nr:hypothetical protein [Candidatus Saccharibacteria bacterium]
MMKRSVIMMALVLFGAVGMATIPTASVSAADCGGNILTLKPWYDGLPMDGDCSIQSPTSDTMSSFIWRIALNIVDDILQIAGYVAFGFVVFGGFLYMTSTGQPEKATRARKTITYGLIGVVVAMSAVLLVNVIASTALGI